MHSHCAFQPAASVRGCSVGGGGSSGGGGGGVLRSVRVHCSVVGCGVSGGRSGSDRGLSSFEQCCRGFSSLGVGLTSRAECRLRLTLLARAALLEALPPAVQACPGWTAEVHCDAGQGTLFLGKRLERYCSKLCRARSPEWCTGFCVYRVLRSASFKLIYGPADSLGLLLPLSLPRPSLAPPSASGHTWDCASLASNS